jgi:ATP-dependent exoDNAse (exonuclease V) beta subunit
MTTIFQRREDSQMIGVTRWIRQFFNQESTSVISPYLANCGQSFHKDIQHYFEKKHVINYSREFKQFLTFVADHSHLETYFIEKSIDTSFFKWRGIVDAVFVDENEQFWLYDWKRSKGSDDALTFPTKDLSTIEYSLLNSYVLQLNIYRIILEAEYDMNIKGMMIAFFHPSLESYKVVEVPRLSSSIERDIIELRLRDLH